MEREERAMNASSRVPLKEGISSISRAGTMK